MRGILLSCHWSPPAGIQRQRVANQHASYVFKPCRYLYGFEEYCRSANIQFRTIHHNEPKVIEVVQKPEDPMEENLKEEPEMSPAEVQNDAEENDCSNESEREEIDQRSPRVSTYQPSHCYMTFWSSFMICATPIPSSGFLLLSESSKNFLYVLAKILQEHFSACSTPTMISALPSPASFQGLPFNCCINSVSLPRAEVPFQGTYVMPLLACMWIEWNMGRCSSFGSTHVCEIFTGQVAGAF